MLTRFTTWAPEHVHNESPNGVGVTYDALNGVAAPSLANTAAGAVKATVRSAAASTPRLKCFA